jgi:hypothetical protein
MRRFANVFFSLWCIAQSTAIGQSAPPKVPANLFAKPSGPFPVGTYDSLWIDQSRGEPFTKDTGDRRHLMVQIWYPAEASPSGDTALYIRNPSEFSEPVFKSILHVKTNAVNGAPLARGERRYPVVLYNHGGAWTRFSATFTTEMLASNGYVVVSVDHTGFNKTKQFPDGYTFVADTLTTPTPTKVFRTDALASWDWLNQSVFPVWVADARFVLDQLEVVNRDPGPFQGRLDLDRIGALGWSFGGATSIELTLVDPRIKAAVDHDGQLFDKARSHGSSRPVMLMHNTDDPTARGTAETKEVMKELVAQTKTWDSLFLARTTAPWYEVTLARTNHGHFSDLWLLHLYPRDTTTLAPQRAFDIINAYTLAFFDKYLRARPAPLLERPSADFPEVTFRAKP